MCHIALLSVSLLAADAARAAEFPAAWQYHQALRLGQTGLVRVDLPAETMDAATPDQHDLRLLDESGREVPFDLERMPATRPVPDPVAEFKTTLEGDATVVWLTTGSTQQLAAVTLDTPAPEFLKPVRIEGSADGRAWTTLASGEPLFRQFGASRLQLPLDGRVWPRLRLTLDNRRSAPIPVTGARLHGVPFVRTPQRPIGVEIVDREEAGSQTRLTLRLAIANATLASLKLQTSEPLFTRNASLVLRRVNENEVVETVLARDTLFRLSGNDGVTAEDVTFDLAAVVPAREAVLVIENGDSPPLSIAGITGGGYPVVITFHTGDRNTFHLLSGHPHAPPRTYDLSALRGQLEPRHVQPQQVAALAVNPAWRAPEALPGLEFAGTAIELADWRYRKPVTLAAAGVQQLELDLEVLSRAAAYFADLRLVRGGRQLPYLLDRAASQRQFAPAVARVADPKRPTTSLWDLKLPHRNLPLARVECATTAPLFQRTATLTEEWRDDRGNTSRVRIGTAEWVRTPDRKSARLTVQFLQAPRTDTVRLEVENGDNPPLELTDFTCWHPATRLLFKADPGAETFLYYGNPAAAAASYDLRLVANAMLAAPKTRAVLGAETALKRAREAAPDGAAGGGTWIFWCVLAGVVVGLLVVLARLLPKPPA